MDDQIGWHDFFYDLDNGGIDDFISKHKIADENFKQFLNNIGNAKFNMADYQQWLSENSKTTNTFASVTSKTENILKSFSSSLGNIAINLIVDEIIGDLNKMANAEKETAEKTKELYNESNMNTQKYKETINVLNDIIEKYKNIPKSDSLDSEKGTKLVLLQNDINALIGQQADNIDLVNGKVDEQLEKLKQISKEQKQAAYYNSIGNYNNSKNAANTAREQEEDDGSDYIYRERSIDKDTLNILEKAGFKFKKSETNILRELFNWSSNGFIQVDADQDENGKPLNTLKEKTDYLKRMQQTLLSKGKGSSGIYTAITRQIETWSDIINKQQNSAEDLVYFYLDFAADSSDIHSTNDFKKYRSSLIETTKKNPDIARILSDGMLNEKDLITIIDSYMITTEGFSDWFIKWKNFSNDKINNTSFSSPTPFTKAWKAISTTGTNEENKRNEEEKQKLLQLAEAGKLTKEEFKNSPIAQTIFKETGLSAEQATQEVNNLIKNVKQLKAMESGISAITSAYDEKKNSETNTVSRSTLESMYDTLGVDEWDNKNKEVWKNYKKCAANGKASMGSLKEAQDELATSFVNSNNFLANLDDTSDDYYETLLKQMGVENADTIVKNELAKKKGLEAIETADLTNMTSDEIAKLIEEKAKTDQARNAMKLFALEKVYANGKALDTTEDINQLINLMDSLGLSTNAVKAYRDYLSGKSENSDVLGANAVIETGLKAGAINEINKARKRLKGKAKNGKEKISTAKTKDSSDNSNKDKTKETKTEIDWLSRRLTRMQSIIDHTAAKLQNLFSIKAKSSNLNKQIKQTNTLMKQYSIAAEKYQKKADLVAGGSTSKIKSNKNKGKKKKVKPLSKDIINKIQSGKITKSSYSKLIKEYGQSNADRINKYIDYFDKAQDARKNKQDAKAKIRGLKQEKLQSWVDLYDSRTARAEAKESIQTTAKDKETTINTQIKNTKLSYEYQIKIAKLSKNKAEADRLDYELQQKIRELEQEKLQNYVDEYNACADLAEINSSNAIGYEKQNGFINTQLSYLKQSYAKQIEIAKLSNDKTEQDRLQAEYKAKEVSLKQEQIDNLKTDYENRIGLVNNDKQDISNSLSETEAKGNIVQAGFYSSLNTYEKKVLDNLMDELGKLQAEQNTFDMYSPQWYDLQSDIQSVENSINEANISIIENNKKIGELRQTMYEDIAARNSDVSSEAQFLASLLGDSLTDDKTGNLTKEGLGVLGTYGIELKANTNTAGNFKQEREEIEKAVAAFKSGDAHALDMYGSLTAAEKTLNEVIKKQQEAISAEYESKKNIYDLMVKRYEAQLAYLKSIIDAKKQVLDMEKDLYDYEKNINSQTKNIAMLEKQMASLKGDDSEEGRARRAKLQVSLDEANQNLQDTEYERYISDQQNMLDNMYTQYEDLLTALEKDFETVVKDGINLINTTAGGISNK